jgi:hypothetical protein
MKSKSLAYGGVMTKTLVSNLKSLTTTLVFNVAGVDETETVLAFRGAQV